MPLRPTAPPEVLRALARHQADEKIRQRQQGLGRPIVAFHDGKHQLVAVKNRLMWGKTWKTFPDFLQQYVKAVLGPEWGNGEIAKPLADRHPIMQWYEAYCLFQRRWISDPGIVSSAEVNGIVACYLGLAYSLYLMDHNADLQARMVARLKDARQFQGAYFEMVVASALIRAGFELALEDESDRRARHCEFAAVKKSNGKRYTVEAKSRAVAGRLGRTAADGGADDKPLSKIKTHLHDALDKPSANERLVFLDINAPADAENLDGNMPLMLAAADLLERYEGHPSAPKESAYVFIVNMAFHRHLDAQPIMLVLPLGFRIPDFNKAGPTPIVERYRQDQRHADAYEIARCLHAVGDFPATFDGSLPSETIHGERPRIKIGEAYEFDDPAGPVKGVVRSACVTDDRHVWMVVETEEGHQIRTEPMSAAAFADWQDNRAAYFGEVQDVPKHPKTPLDLYARFMEIFRDYDRRALALQIGLKPDDHSLAGLTDEELREQVSNALVQNLSRSRPTTG